MDVEEGEASEHEEKARTMPLVWLNRLRVTESTQEPSDDDVLPPCPISLSGITPGITLRTGGLCALVTARRVTHLTPYRIRLTRTVIRMMKSGFGEERTDESPNKFYAVWIHKLKSVDLSIMTTTKSGSCCGLWTTIMSLGGILVPLKSA